MEKWRVIDTGVLSAAENMAWDYAFLRAQSEDESGMPILRFLRFSPSCVLVGRHQSPAQEARCEYVAQRGWHINRRITGGGAIFFDTSQIGWEVIASDRQRWVKRSMEKLYKKISAGAISALQKLGIRANYRPRNDIEVSGRKISGTGGASDGRAILFQGTLLVKDCADDMLKALRVPAEKLGRHGLESVRERVVFLEELLSPLPEYKVIKQAFISGFADVFQAEMVVSEPSESEVNIFNDVLPHISSDKWIYEIDNPAEQKGVLIGFSRGKGILRAALQVDVQKKRVSSVQFWGDFFIAPTRSLPDLEALLKHRRAKYSVLREIIVNFFQEKRPSIIGLKPENFVAAVKNAVSKLPLIEQGFSFDEANRLYFINLDPARWREFPFEQFLFPYCSKLVGCKFRHRHDCPICEKCTVGEGHRLVIDAGLKPYTITSFQSLMNTHRRFRKNNIRGYIGSCCEEFLVKHHNSFIRSGLSIVLIKLDSTTCYDLSQARAAYRGEFESQTEMDVELLKKVLKIWKK